MKTGQLYKATLDKQANWGLKWGTYPTLLILIGICCVLFVLPDRYMVYFATAFSALIFIFTLIYYLTRSVRGYILYKDKLVIKRILSEGNIEIILSDIEKTERFAEEDFYKSRRISNFSMFGYYGDFHHPTFGYYKIYATNLSNLIMIEMKNNKKIVISPDDVGLMVVLKKNI